MTLAENQRRTIRSTTVMLLLVLLYVPTFAVQEPRATDQTAPPPLKIITRVEREQLAAAKDEKQRVKLSVELAEAHLLKAEAQTNEQQFDLAAAEAGMYWAIIEDVFSFMKASGRDNTKKRDLYKRLELSLRAHAPRLTIMRRNTPAAHAVWIKEIEEFARKGRTEALNSFYGTTVIRENPQKSEAKDINKPLRER
ncbi:MAG TPA: hypothetical protein VGC61_08920 [Pyrinomonadaceae bacterium]